MAAGEAAAFLLGPGDYATGEDQRYGLAAKLFIGSLSPTYKGMMKIFVENQECYEQAVSDLAAKIL